MAKKDRTSQLKGSACVLAVVYVVGVALAAGVSPQLRMAGAAEAASYATLPLSFEPNQGQTDPQVQFLSRGAGYTLFLTRDAAVLSLKDSGARNPKPVANDSALAMRLVGSNPNAPASGIDELAGKSNYFIGRDAANWRANVPNYSKVECKGVYSGIDLVY